MDLTIPTLANRRINVNRFIAHLIVISMLFLLPELIMNYAMSQSPRHSGEIQWQMYAKSFIFILVFYIEYYWIISRTLTPKVKVWRFIIYNLLIFIVTLGICYLLWYFLAYLPRIAESAAHPIRNIEKFKLMFVSSLVRDGAMIILTAGLAVALRLSDNWGMLERRRRDMESEQRASELQRLKSQLNPHFLFNTLNSIYALIDIAPADAQTAVHELSQMLRYMLYESPSQVSLRQETDFTDNYIRLMKLRLPDGIVKTDIDISAMADTAIAPLVFIPLVENAFKHGNTGSADDSISVSITASGGIVTCRTGNRFTPDNASRHGGIGIANLRRRLLLIYGSRASLATRIHDGMYHATLTIDTRP